ncbi:hypothetical protein GWK47_033632 [Chionoecetes opilio]|uniref:Uncharacterized protein n=1 Tax=Chionoecetes opilio TaxID=41210 RepID=A0A8J5D3A2_CHIOP|nr:hypothetical protein GWK47_033632 [Chionoecetes opilio]
MPRCSGRGSFVKIGVLRIHPAGYVYTPHGPTGPDSCQESGSIPPAPSGSPRALKRGGASPALLRGSWGGLGRGTRARLGTQDVSYASRLLARYSRLDVRLEASCVARGPPHTDPYSAPPAALPGAPCHHAVMSPKKRVAGWCSAMTYEYFYYWSDETCGEAYSPLCVFTGPAATRQADAH